MKLNWLRETMLRIKRTGQVYKAPVSYKMQNGEAVEVSKSTSERIRDDIKVTYMNRVKDCRTDEEFEKLFRKIDKLDSEIERAWAAHTLNVTESCIQVEADAKFTLAILGCLVRIAKHTSVCCFYYAV